MLRRKIKSAGAVTLQFTGVAGVVGRCTGNTRLPLVVGYHRVVEDFAAQAHGYKPSMLTSTAMLEKQLDWIGRRFAFADPDDMNDWLAGRCPEGRPVAIITFDDGYRDVYENALPLLKRKGIPAVVFVVTDLVGTDRLLLHDELFLLLSRAFSNWRDPGKRVRELLEEAEAGKWWPALSAEENATPLRWKQALLARLPQAALLRIIQTLRREAIIPDDIAAGLQAMDWDMLGKLRDAGICVGSHTRSHVLLTNEEPRTAREQILDSRDVLEETLGSKVCHFAYPDGRFDESVVTAVAEAGYRFAYTTCRHRDDRFPALTIPRRLLWENACMDSAGRFSSAVMSCQVNGAFDYPAKCRMRHAA
ncbi:MAG: polysaccharide deacetylase family protein [Gammaproteobacteria bacterium]